MGSRERERERERVHAVLPDGKILQCRVVEP